MASLVPSFISKINRAEKHLSELERAIESYTASHSYEVQHRLHEGQRTPFLHVTAQPENTEIPIITGDIVQNVYAGLNHLAVMLARTNRGSIMFPIFWRGVWEDAHGTDNDQRGKDRGRWNTYVRDMRPDAVAILRDLQPPNDEDNPAEIHYLRFIQRLANTDRHKQLNAIASGFSELEAKITKDDGSVIEVVDAQPRFGAIVKDGARIVLQQGEVDVEISGIQRVMVRVNDPEGEIVVPEGFGRLIKWVREKAIEPLAPLVYP